MKLKTRAAVLLAILTVIVGGLLAAFIFSTEALGQSERQQRELLTWRYLNSELHNQVGSTFPLLFDWDKLGGTEAGKSTVAQVRVGENSTRADLG